MTELADTIDALALESAFSGVVRVDRADELVEEKAFGLADRRWEIPNTADTRFAIASGVKGMTALAVVSLVEDGTIELRTTARSLLGEDLPLIDDAVTIEHLLAHRSGIGDYFDEDLPGEITDYVLSVPVHTLAETEDYLAALDGFPTKFPPDERFSYCNGGYAVLALLAERASGVPFRELVARRVCEPAGMSDTGFLRSDELPARAAVGYLDADGLRTNVRGSSRRPPTSGVCGRRCSRSGSSPVTGCAR
jgi:CubicO group peptidase (beta-lactamase class C family)